MFFHDVPLMLDVLSPDFPRMFPIFSNIFQAFPPPPAAFPGTERLHLPHGRGRGVERAQVPKGHLQRACRVPSIVKEIYWGYHGDKIRVFMGRSGT